MTGHAIYRQPYSDECVAISGKVHRLDGEMVLSPIKGFVITPFTATPHEYKMYIDASEVVRYNVSDIPFIPGFDIPFNGNFTDHELTFDEFKSQIDYFGKCILEHQIEKGVAVRHVNYTSENIMDPLNLFRKACELYPRMMVAMFSTPQSGTWLVCSPKLLVERMSNNIYHTSAIAGTRPLESEGGEWEPRVVKDFNDVQEHIVNTVSYFADNVQVDGPRTVRAGDLLHMKSDIVFKLLFPRAEGVIVRTLHPSPCVCGIPRDITYQLINDLNTAYRQSRHFFGGNVGPVNIDDSTTIHVILHSMHLHGMHQASIYAGTSVYLENDINHKWSDTELKMRTMIKVIESCG